MNIGVAEVFQREVKTEKILNFLYSQDSALFSQAQKKGIS